MASSIADSARDLVATMTENKKIADLRREIKDSHSKQTATTDFGAKISDLDHWLKIVDEKGESIGPSLLEDEIARERVWTIPSSSNGYRPPNTS